MTKLIWVGTAALALSMSHTARGGIVTHSVECNAALQQVHFSITFDHAPDFFTLDEYGRPADDFYFGFDMDPIHYTPFIPYESMISGHSIHETGQVGAYATWPPVPDGYPLLGWLPYTLEGNTISFTASYQLLLTETGFFTYEIGVGQYGGSDYLAFNQVPTQVPAGGTLSVVGLALGTTLRRRQR